jgi:2-polyprenyl-3-methyl-5-hydroxy-6-metoxy-1,4-benzoquinol methylase
VDDKSEESRRMRYLRRVFGSPGGYAETKKSQFILDSIERFRLEKYPLCSSLDVLDAGCGTGEISRKIATQGHNVKGLDIRGDFIEIARFRTSSRNCSFDVCDVSELSKLGRRFNVVVFSEVIEHMKDAHRGLQSIRDALERPGQLILTTPNSHGPYELLYKRPLDAASATLRRIMRWQEKLGERHVNLFTYPAIIRMLEKYGFRICSTRNSDFLSFLPYVRTSRLARADCGIADRLPPFLSSGWYFNCYLEASSSTA